MHIIELLKQLWPHSRKALVAEIVIIGSFYVFIEAVSSVCYALLSSEITSLPIAKTVILIASGTSGIIASVVFLYLQEDAKKEKTGITFEVETLSKIAKDVDDPARYISLHK